MKHAARTSQVILFGLVGLLLAGQASSRAQDKKVHEKHDSSALYFVLRDVINSGAKMYNDHGDHAGCYRLYQGSLMSVRPFLAPDLQKNIDEGLANAERLPVYADRAFELRRVLDEIRIKTRPADLKIDAKPDTAGQVAGTVTYQGQPITGGYFVTLLGADSKKFSSAIQKNGTFQFKTPIPAGEYRVAVEPIPGEKLKGAALPKRYAASDSSGLSIHVQSGKQQVELNLVN